MPSTQTTMEGIGMYKGKFISKMTRDELLDFAKWAARRIQDLEKISDIHHELDLHREVLSTLTP